jgi:uncharacterized phage protein (TIGR01671 family)
MMREVKFRAWDIKNKCMEDGFTGLYWFEHAGVREVKDGIGHGYTGDFIIMQFTGLRDKSGREIYEGDILRWWGHEVRNGRQIRPERFFPVSDYVKDVYRIACITEGTGEVVEVIGTIHENGDLL